VVVRIWDHRRLVLPTSYFVKTPFQNWTRTSADLLATVSLHVDYTVPVEDVRTELKRILDDSSRWDGHVWAMQVVDSDAATMELRALMSAPNSGTAWELRCEVRERLIDFLQRRFPESLPRVRADLAGTISADGDPRLAHSRRDQAG
jgi:small-conductance mechanosensitive channel